MRLLTHQHDDQWRRLNDLYWDELVFEIKRLANRRLFVLDIEEALMHLKEQVRVGYSLQRNAHYERRRRESQ